MHSLNHRMENNMILTFGMIIINNVIRQTLKFCILCQDCSQEGGVEDDVEGDDDVVDMFGDIVSENLVDVELDSIPEPVVQESVPVSGEPETIQQRNRRIYIEKDLIKSNKQAAKRLADQAFFDAKHSNTYVAKPCCNKTSFVDFVF